MSTAVMQPPDLLRRFVPTPYSSFIETGRGILKIQSNDGAFSYRPKPYRISENRPLECVLIRDHEVPQYPRTVIFQHGELSTVVLREGGHIHFDHDVGEIIGFVSPEIDTSVIIHWIERLLSLAEPKHE